MSSAAAIRLHVETRLRDRIPDAFTIPERIEAPVLSAGISALDQQIDGIPCAAMTEVCASSVLTTGATSMLISLLSRTSEENFCPWGDGTDAFNSRWAHSAGTDLNRVLWSRYQDNAANARRLGRLDCALQSVDLLRKTNRSFGLIVVDLPDVPEKLLGHPTLQFFDSQVVVRLSDIRLGCYTAYMRNIFGALWEKLLSFVLSVLPREDDA